MCLVNCSARVFGCSCRLVQSGAAYVDDVVFVLVLNVGVVPAEKWCKALAF